MQNAYSQKFLKRRKFLLLLPLLTLPFITLAFWALGGGSLGRSSANTESRGLNLALPEAKLKEEAAMDKLSFYDQAQEDSIRLRQERRNDPYYKFRLDTMTIQAASPTTSLPTAPARGLHTSPYAAGTATATEKRITERLEALQKAVETPMAPPKEGPMSRPAFAAGDPTDDISRLENLMEDLQANNADDPEVTELNSILEKILDIQHPDRVKDKMQKTATGGKPAALPVSKSAKALEASYLGTEEKQRAGNRFYGETQSDQGPEPSNTIAATTAQTQTVTAGGNVKLQLAEDVVINGTRIPKGTFIYGRAILQEERMLVSVNGIRYKDRLYPVALSAYDLDGLPGIYVPGSLTRESVKSAADQQLGSLQLLAYDPSLKGQAAAAGIGAAKGLLSKKAKLTKITLKAGYTVLLKDDSPTH